MWNLIRRTVTAAFAASIIICTASTAYAESQQLYKGDTVQYIFTLGEADNIAGVSVSSFYNSNLLEMSGSPEFLIDGQGMSNVNLTDEVRWNTMISGGRAFSNEDVVVETFIVKEKCSVDDTALSFSCTELFSHSMQSLPRQLLSARIEIQNTGTDEDTQNIDSDSEKSSETEIQTDSDSGINTSDTESRTESKTESRSENKTESKNESSSKPAAESYPIKPVIITNTDNTPSEDETIDNTAPTTSSKTGSSVSSRQSVSSSTSAVSNNGSSEKTKSETKTEAETSPSSRTTGSVSSDKPEKKTPDQANSKTDSEKENKETKTNAEKSTDSSLSSSSQSTSTVQTAGKIAAVVFILIFAAAGVTVAVTKKRNAIE